MRAREVDAILDRLADEVADIREAHRKVDRSNYHEAMRRYKAATDPAEMEAAFAELSNLTTFDEDPGNPNLTVPICSCALHGDFRAFPCPIRRMAERALALATALAGIADEDATWRQYVHRILVKMERSPE